MADTAASEGPDEPARGLRQRTFHAVKWATVLNLVIHAGQFLLQFLRFHLVVIHFPVQPVFFYRQPGDHDLFGDGYDTQHYDCDKKNNQPGPQWR